MILFLLPLVAIFLPAIGVFSLSGEWYSARAVENLMNQPEPVLIGQAYSNFGPFFQVDQVKQRAPEILALGNSHVGQFRAVFFRDPSAFYNATGAVAVLSDYRNFIQQLTETPKIIVVNMEPGMFNDDEQNNLMSRPNPYTSHEGFYDPLVESLFRNGGWWRIYTDYAAGKFTLSEVYRSSQSSVRTVGLRAIATGEGETNDGSSYWGNALSDPHTKEKTQEQIKSVVEAITNTKSDGYGKTISDAGLTELREFLALCKSRDITVIGFLPPLAHAVYVDMQQHPHAIYADSFINLASTLKSTYKEYGFDFYDFRDIATFGSSDDEMIEAKHGGEKMYLRLFIAMAKKSPSLQPLVDVSYLEKRLQTATSSYIVFGLQK